MHFSELSPHVHFLSDAAHLLSQSAPETSAFLMRRRTELLVENDIPISAAQRQHVCSACGHIMVPGQGATLTMASEKARRPKGKSKSKSLACARQTSSPASAPSAQTRAMPGGISKVVTCGSCLGKTSVRVQGPHRISRASKTTQQSRIAGRGRPQVAAEPVKSSANASSKKRAKNRKAGLQALLDQKQGSASLSCPSSGFGLSLSDFMKK